MNDVRLQFRDVRFYWRGETSPVLDIADFKVAGGERIFLHGPSGSGKSTLLSLIAGVQVANSGEVIIEKENLSALRQGRRDRFRADHIGYIFQQFNLLPYLDCLHNVTLACEFSPARRARLKEQQLNPLDEARRLLLGLGIDSKLHSRKAGQLSVGQQQRVAAARALIGSPPLVIADEPTSALDAESRMDFLRLLFTECKRANSTLVFVSHDAELASRFDRSISLSEINQAVSVS